MNDSVAGVYSNAIKKHPLLQSFCMVLSPVLECVHMHKYCVKVNMVDCFPDLSACSKSLINP